MARHPIQVVSLIGMPGSGKSTVGVLLAKRLGLAFVDTDLLIQEQEQACLLYTSPSPRDLSTSRMPSSA